MSSTAEGAGARYDGVADWYDTYAVPGEETLAALGRLVGRGTGLALDLGCGTGLYLDYLHLSSAGAAALADQFPTGSLGMRCFHR